MLETHKIHLPLHANVERRHARVIVKTLTLPKMNVKLPWYSEFSFSFFYLEKIVNKMKTISVTVIVMILKKSESDLISPMTGVLSQQVQLKTLLSWINICANFFLGK